MIQYSEVSGGNNDAESVARMSGTLLTRNDLSMSVDCALSFLKVAFAKTSNDAKTRSMIVVCISP